VSDAQLADSAAARADRTVRGQGTPESSWAEWRGWQQELARTLDELVPAGHRLVVVAPHPDDEVLAAGGVIRQASAAGREVCIVGVTRGGGSHPGSTRWPAKELVRSRIEERLAALAILGVPPQAVTELDLADGAVEAAVEQLVAELCRILRPSDVVISPWLFDGHPDHEATARAVRRACAARTARHLQAPIWGWHWASPDGGELPDSGVLLVALDEPTRRAKLQAIDCFTSQLQPDESTGQPPILPGWALSRFARRHEVLLP
jgi:LmbE family N-acetylglucosaminyl deacetylase